MQNSAPLCILIASLSHSLHSHSRLRQSGRFSVLLCQSMEGTVVSPYVINLSSPSANLSPPQIRTSSRITDQICLYSTATAASLSSNWATKYIVTFFPFPLLFSLKSHCFLHNHMALCRTLRMSTHRNRQVFDVEWTYWLVGINLRSSLSIFVCCSTRKKKNKSNNLSVLSEYYMSPLEGWNTIQSM